MDNHLQRHIAVLALIVIAVSLFFPFVPVAHAEWTEKNGDLTYPVHPLI
ncbi:hypothetical protein SAMN04488112_13113 [Melghirimyces thermohalophilus]|uniref:Uncharacterized protein n=1 Tax=Melghirimyces thermohalophilus TaxID=1236220 RepID=A0A1G6RTK1_9BACL|nr:hypothetical protein [Melghirimyces thermohalophilus]SDD07909.1 hypothetical protein SAMN04488112_13113 [Melghirimyces thermohalophilus]